MSSNFPRLSSAKPYPTRNQFGRAARAAALPCACCDAFAAFHVVVQLSLFRSEDMNLFLCDLHADYARREQWRALFTLLADNAA